MATTQCSTRMFYSSSSFFLYFCNVVALILWGKKILTGFSWKYIFSKCSSCVRLHLKSQSSFFDIYVQGLSCGGRNGTVICSVLMVPQVVHVIFVTWPVKGAFTIWMSLAQPPAPNEGALCFIHFTDAIHKKSFGSLLTPEYWHQNTAFQRIMSLWGYLYLKTYLFSSPFHYIRILVDAKFFVFPRSWRRTVF